MTIQPQSAASLPSSRSLTVRLAKSPDEIRAGQRLRYDVFAREMGAVLHNHTPGLDDDDLDPYCQHLLVRDLVSQEIVGYTRILTDHRARLAGGFYSQSEFDLAPLLTHVPGRYMELGRTCIHRDYRSGATIAVLWSGVASFIAANGIDYLIGCASIPLAEGSARVRGLCAHLQARYPLPPEQRVIPLNPLAMSGAEASAELRLPPLLKAYLRLGARIGGDPCFDPDFNVADLFIFVPTERIEKRYARHFIERADEIAADSLGAANAEWSDER